MTTEQRFFSKVHMTVDGCWLWTAGKTSGGYGAFWCDGRQIAAHAWSWQLANGPVPDGLQLDHLCRNRSCVNPTHLEPVTICENVLRGIGHAAVNARKTRCSRGHALTGTNLIEKPNARNPRRPPYRSCRECENAAKRERRRRSAA